MAVWGAPTAREDDAERAVRAGLDLVDAVRVLGAGHPGAGRCSDRGSGRHDRRDATRAWSRATSSTRQRGCSRWRRPARSLSANRPMRAAGCRNRVRGGRRPVAQGQVRARARVARRCGSSRSAAARAASDLPEPPFVGRDDELRLLKDRASEPDAIVGRASSRSAGPAASARAASHGSSRSTSTASPSTIYWHRGRSPVVRRGHHVLGAGRDGPATRRSRRRRRRGDHPRADRARSSPSSCPPTMTGDGSSPRCSPSSASSRRPAGGRDVLFAAWRIFFERIAERGTTVLLFEDLQWADTGLLDFIEHLLEWSKGVPLGRDARPTRALRPPSGLGRGRRAT